MKVQIQTSNEDFYKKYYQALNGILKLTNKEFLILERLSYRKSQGLEDKELFSSKIRTEIAQELNMSKFNFNNYIKTLTDRKILVRTNKQLAINPSIYKNITDLPHVDLNIRFNIVWK